MSPDASKLWVRMAQKPLPAILELKHTPAILVKPEVCSRPASPGDFVQFNIIPLNSWITVCFFLLQCIWRNRHRRVDCWKRKSPSTRTRGSNATARATALPSIKRTPTFTTPRRNRRHPSIRCSNSPGATRSATCQSPARRETRPLPYRPVSTSHDSIITFNHVVNESTPNAFLKCGLFATRCTLMISLFKSRRFFFKFKCFLTVLSQSSKRQPRSSRFTEYRHAIAPLFPVHSIDWLSNHAHFSVEISYFVNDRSATRGKCVLLLLPLEERRSSVFLHCWQVERVASRKRYARGNHSRGNVKCAADGNCAACNILCASVARATLNTTLAQS